MKKIIFITNHCSFFYSHRLNIYEFAKKKNFNFSLVSGNGNSSQMEKVAINALKKKKINVFKFNFSSENSFFYNLGSLFKILFFLSKEKPDIIHSASPIANFFALFCSIFLKNTKLVLSISGMGYLGTKKNKKKILSFLFNFFFYNLLNYKKNIKIIIQNKDDLNYFIKNKKISRKKLSYIYGGSGISLEKSFKVQFSKKKKIVLMVARLVKSKGVIEYLSAAEFLKKKFPKWIFCLCGPNDYKSIDIVNFSLIKDFQKRKIINYLPYQENLSKIYKKSSIFVLPSYREGFPKTIMEASYYGNAIVTTNSIGTKEAIIPQKTGLLCKLYSSKDLAKKIEYLIVDKKKRYSFGNNANIFAKKKFDIRIITKKIFKNYE